MPTIVEIEEEIIDEFSIFDDWVDKYAHLIELGKDVPVIDDALKTDDNLIKGCQSRVWLSADFENNKIIYKADSDAIITKGIIGLLVRVLSNQSPTDILNNELNFINEIGLKEHLSPTRSNGLVSMIKQMKFYAIAFQAKAN